MYIFPRLNIASIVAGLFRGYGVLVLLKWYRVIQKAILSLYVNGIPESSLYQKSNKARVSL